MNKTLMLSCFLKCFTWHKLFTLESTYCAIVGEITFISLLYHPSVFKFNYCCVLLCAVWAPPLTSVSCVTTEGPGWHLNVVYNSLFLWLRFAAALGMFNCPCLLYFPRAVLHAIPSAYLQPPLWFPASGGLSDQLTSSCPSLSGWWHRRCLFWKFPHCAECEEHTALVPSWPSLGTRGIALKIKEHKNSIHTFKE